MEGVKMKVITKNKLIPFHANSNSKNSITAKMIYDFKNNILGVVYEVQIQNLLFGCDSTYQINKSQKYLRKDDLWKTTCFEFFLKNKLSNQYLEMNLSCNNEWNLYLFKNYRERDDRADLESLQPLSITRNDLSSEDPNLSFNQGFKLEIQFPLQPLVKLIGAEHHWQFNLTAVTEYTNNTKEYWAIQHAQGQPDFHDFGSMLQFSDKLT
jgi:hypothetical protein